MIMLFLILLNTWIFRFHQQLRLHYLLSLKNFTPRRIALMYWLRYINIVGLCRIDWNELALITLIAAASTAILGHFSLHNFLTILPLIILLSIT